MGYKLDDKDVKLTGKQWTKIGTGAKGDVYKYRNMALKVFKEDRDTPIDVYTAEYLSNISTDRILLPQNLLFYNNAFKGYTYKLVSKKGTGQRMIMLPKQELIQDIRILEEDIKTLSNKSVLLNGISPENSIFNGELYLVDPTEYRVLEDCSTKELEELNKFQLHLLLTTLISFELRKNNFTSKTERNAKELFGMKEIGENSSRFFSDIIGNNESIKEFVKKI